MMPSRPDFLHCSRRRRANKPSGEEEEIAERGEPLLFFVAPAAARAFLVFPPVRSVVLSRKGVGSEPTI